jgi:hypothetical protein
MEKSSRWFDGASVQPETAVSESEENSVNNNRHERRAFDLVLAV